MHYALQFSQTANYSYMIEAHVKEAEVAFCSWLQRRYNGIEAQPQTKSASQLVTEKSTIRSVFRIDAALSGSLVLECESWHSILLTGTVDVHLPR